MKKFLGAFLCCFLAFFATAQTSNTNQVYFEYAKSSLTAEAEESLLQFLEQTTPNAVLKSKSTAIPINTAMPNTTRSYRRPAPNQ